MYISLSLKIGTHAIHRVFGDCMESVMNESPFYRRRFSVVAVRMSFVIAAAILVAIPATAQSSSSNGDDQTTQDSASAKKSGGLWSKLTANAKYQQAKQSGDPNANNYLPQDSGGSSKDSKKKKLCNINDDGVSLQPDGSWAGPNCITSDGNGHAKNPADMKDNKSKGSDDDQAKKAADTESHSCMTTEGADKANELADDCKKVADHPDKACNIQQNSCDDIKKATQKGCWGKGAEGPDWCLTRYH
jgi:hypothetical protein